MTPLWRTSPLKTQTNFAFVISVYVWFIWRESGWALDVDEALVVAQYVAAVSLLALVSGLTVTWLLLQLDLSHAGPVGGTTCKVRTDELYELEV